MAPTKSDDPGVQKIEWARGRMGMLAASAQQLRKQQHLDGVKVGMALHVEAKTAVLALTLAEAGATVRLASCNPLSTDDDVAIALKKHYGLDVRAKRGIDRETYYDALKHTVANAPEVIIDDGGDLTGLVHAQPRLLKALRGICEETTTGIVRAHSMHREGALKVPLFDINGARMKHLFDNRYGTGQSSLDGFLRATNLSIAGKSFVVAGYGWCGRGVAMRARGLGAEVTVTEIDPVRAIEARYDGYRVAPMNQALKTADVVITATGNRDIIGQPQIKHLKQGVLLANAGHFDNEIDKAALKRESNRVKVVRPDVEEFRLRNGRTIYLLADGRLINLVSGAGHPVEVMDGSFSVQALTAAHAAHHGPKMPAGVHPVPRAIDEQVARFALKTMGLSIDRLTKAQRHYMASWSEGT